MKVDELTGWELKLIYLTVKSDKLKKSYADLRKEEEARMRAYIKRAIGSKTS